MSIKQTFITLSLLISALSHASGGTPPTQQKLDELAKNHIECQALLWGAWVPANLSFVRDAHDPTLYYLMSDKGTPDTPNPLDAVYMFGGPSVSAKTVRRYSDKEL